MAAAIIISTFGCMNGLILTGACACFAIARDGLFFRGAAILNQARVPGWRWLHKAFGPRSGAAEDLWRHDARLQICTTTC